MKKLIKSFFSTLFAFACIGAVLAAGYFMLTETPYYKWQKTEAAEVTEYGSPHKFYYRRLSNTEKHAYNEIITRIYEMPEAVEIPDIDAEQLDRIFSALLYDNPDLFFLGRRCTLSAEMMKTFCSFEYTMTKDEYLIEKEKLEKAVQKVISSLSDPEDEWQTELEIHDYIIDSCKYTLREPKLAFSSSYAVLVNGQAACEGYSKAAKLLFDAVGIESAVVSGISKNFDGEDGAHMWNAVKIGGEYYYLDCTWDDPINKDKKDNKFYSYFNVNEEMISQTHSEFSYDFGCTATEANYFIRTGRFFDEYSRSYEKRLTQIIADDISSGNWVIQIRFGSAEAYNKACSDLLDNERIYSVLSRADDMTDERIDYKTISFYKNPEQKVLILIPERG